MNENNYMDLAIKQAKKAASLNEVPIGAVLLDYRSKELLSARHNETLIQANPLKHAEILVIEDACKKLGITHEKHIVQYGAHNEERLTGLHETCSMQDFKFGVSDRGASMMKKREQ